MYVNLLVEFPDEADGLRRSRVRPRRKQMDASLHVSVSHQSSGLYCPGLASFAEREI